MDLSRRTTCADNAEFAVPPTRCHILDMETDRLGRPKPIEKELDQARGERSYSAGSAADGGFRETTAILAMASTGLPIAVGSTEWMFAIEEDTSRFCREVPNRHATTRTAL